MKLASGLRSVLVAAACAWLAAAAARAAPVHIEVTGLFQLPSQAAPHSVEMAFDVDPLLPGLIVEGPAAFGLEGLAVQTRVDGHVVSNVARMAGWFWDPLFNFAGIDVRVEDFMSPGDMMQFIWFTPQSLFSGTSDSPSLDLLSLSDLGGLVCHYPTGSGGCTEGTLASGTYAASDGLVVPVPSTALLLPLGLMLLGWQRGRRQAAGLPLAA